MTPDTLPNSVETPEILGENAAPDFPVGVETTGPDDLGDWWLDLGAVDLPGALAV